MKSDFLYPYYINYLESRLKDNRISTGAFFLLRLSSGTFEDFKYNFDNDELFKLKIIESYKVKIRDDKIKDIFDDID